MKIDNKDIYIEKGRNKKMLGAIVGDIVGSIYEFNNIRTKNFMLFPPECFFTDDTVMTMAVAEALRKTKRNHFVGLDRAAIEEMQKYGQLYPDESYGMSFRAWLRSNNPRPYGSYGNGAAMRISPVAYYANSIEEVKALSKAVTAVTHNHPEGIKGAEATDVATYMALNHKSKEEIISYIKQNYYDLNFTYEDLVKNNRFNESCQNTVPQAIFCFEISQDFEDCLRISVSIGGDTDTMCAISCGIAGAYYGVPEDIKNRALSYLDKRLLKVYNDFLKKISSK